MDFSNEFLNVDVFAVGVNLIVVFFKTRIDLKFNLDLILLHFLENEVDELLLKQELRIHVKCHVFCHFILEVAFEGCFQSLVAHTMLFVRNLIIIFNEHLVSISII